MRVLQVSLSYHPEVGGVEKHLKLITQELSKKHEVKILCTTKTPAGFEEPGITKDGRVVVERVPYKTLGYTSLMIDKIKEEGADVVHAHNYSTFQPYLASKAVSDYVFTPHFHEKGKKPLIVRKVFDAFFGRPALRNASQVVAVSEYEKQKLGEYNDNITVIPNPVSLEKFSKIKKRTWKNHVLFIGRLEKYKNVDTLIRAVKKLSGVQLSIIGSGPDMNRLKRVAHGDTRVRFLGRVSDKKLVSTLSKADVLVNLSSKEAFGIVFAQALAAKTPAIALNKGAPPTIFGRALLYAENSVDDVAQKIQMVLQDPQLRKRLVKRGKEVVEEFEPRNVAKKTLEVYEKLTR